MEQAKKKSELKSDGAKSEIEGVAKSQSEASGKEGGDALVAQKETGSGKEAENGAQSAGTGKTCTTTAGTVYNDKCHCFSVITSRILTPQHTFRGFRVARGPSPGVCTQNKKLVKVSQKVGRKWSPCIKRKYWP